MPPVSKVMRSRAKSLRHNQTDAETALWHLLRFWNNDILTNPEGVLTSLLAALATPLPAGASHG
ncbi:hypothetical protein [Sphingomonas sp. ID0503]|uniref:hypothetical protein n=1 Tax=Sphingomonas sp. ID0503 TaxID=3399691 RepID=UPI003AFAE2FD